MDGSKIQEVVSVKRARARVVLGWVTPWEVGRHSGSTLSNYIHHFLLNPLELSQHTRKQIIRYYDNKQRVGAKVNMAMMCDRVVGDHGRVAVLYATAAIIFS